METSFCEQTILMPHHSFFKEIYSLSHGFLSVKFAVYCVIKLGPTLIFHSAPSYWLSHFNFLEMVPCIFLTGKCHVNVFQTELQCLKLFSIIMAANIFKENIATFHKSVGSFRRNTNWAVLLKPFLPQQFTSDFIEDDFRAIVEKCAGIQSPPGVAFSQGYSFHKVFLRMIWKRSDLHLLNTLFKHLPILRK